LPHQPDASRKQVQMNFTIEQEQEADGRWLAEVIELPGVMAYGTSSTEVVSKVEALALRVIAEQLSKMR
jgi:predicted RNase H-like HicB family nuclease